MSGIDEGLKPSTSNDTPVEPEQVTHIKLPIELAIGLERYLSEKPLREVYGAWTGLKQALQDAGVEDQ